MYHNLSAVDYKALYAKYLENGHQPGFFLDWANFQPGHRVLDLCSGVLMRIPHLAIDRGAKWVFAVDPIFSSWTINIVDTNYRAESDFPALHYLSSNDPIQETGTIYLADHEVDYSVRNWRDVEEMRFEVVTCQQAINYWFDRNTISYLPKLMVPGGRFVFNTFNKKPPTEPTFKTYMDSRGKVLGEAFYTIDNVPYMHMNNVSVVHHWQMREGVPPHHTVFRWITREEFITTLEEFFHVQLLSEYGTDIYICTKRE